MDALIERSSIVSFFFFFLFFLFLLPLARLLLGSFEEDFRLDPRNERGKEDLGEKELISSYTRIRLNLFGAEEEQRSSRDSARPTIRYGDENERRHRKPRLHD